MNEITDKKLQSWINQAAKLPTKKTVSHNIAPNLWIRITTHTQKTLRHGTQHGINPNDLEREQKAQCKTVREVFNLMVDNLKIKGVAKNSIISLTTFSNNYLT